MGDRNVLLTEGHPQHNILIIVQIDYYEIQRRAEALDTEGKAFDLLGNRKLRSPVQPALACSRLIEIPESEAVQLGNGMGKEVQICPEIVQTANRDPR
uniref:Uncharacterized protein n=1 Tax=Chromera velia CCMP2878 TaxID=1169474 RepID=A0A0G4H3L8_9ALVE|eukprot:Cvel_24573.t1-p1 / transcript=Cvel_24573.t1 / gene=Cvel_24573 / organism=Chromera_velia_CCMP2878 / gene_product=hypothetical protein / transcript_product=hypothetical protein / location=Cvel_scaffold2674:10642-10932(+) / protein_length=97 / sequence_SO=supercontig / SO=protein_coding / is_pseudo=false